MLLLFCRDFPYGKSRGELTGRSWQRCMTSMALQMCMYHSQISSLHPLTIPPIASKKVIFILFRSVNTYITFCASGRGIGNETKVNPYDLLPKREVGNMEEFFPEMSEEEAVEFKLKEVMKFVASSLYWQKVIV